MSKIDTKGLGKAARKLAKAGSLPPGLELRPTVKREGNGRVTRAAVPRDPLADMLKARCRRWGKPSSQWREMRDPWWGCEAGGAMALATKSLTERKAYWDAICWMRRVMIAFDRVMGAPSRNAQCLRLMLPIPPTGTNESEPALDTRTDEQKQDDAVRDYQRLGELSGRAGLAAQAEAFRVVLDDQPPHDVAAMLMVLRQISCGIDPRALT